MSDGKRASSVGDHCRRRALLASMLALGLGACAHAAKETVKSATPAAVESAAKTASEPETRDRIADVLSDEQIRNASAALSQAIADGVLEALADPARAARFRAVADSMVRQVGSTAAKSLSDDLGPAIAGVVASSVDQSLTTALDQDRLQAASLAIARGTLRGMSAGMQDTADGVHGSNGIVRAISRDAAFGVQDALSPWLLVSLGVLVAFAFAVVIAAIWRLTSYRKQSRAREHAVHLLAKAIHKTEHEPWAAELQQRIREAVDEDSAASADESRDVLLRHLELRPSH